MKQFAYYQFGKTMVININIEEVSLKEIELSSRFIDHASSSLFKDPVTLFKLFS